MNKIEKIFLTNASFYIEIKEAKLKLLCASPEDIVKHLLQKRVINKDEVKGVICESGPNAILLSDLSVQNSSFSNLCEFPILQMLYRQGQLLPNHPNNTGIKPIIIGKKKQVDAQLDYIFRGNYGLKNIDEILSCGIDEKEAKVMMEIKNNFAFGEIKSSKKILDPKYLPNGDKIEIINEVFIQRISTNNFEITYKNETINVDLNLQENEEYTSTYKLGFYDIKRDYFSIIHSGQGDGWNITSPSMSSVLMYQGKIYLIDAGPNISVVLNSLGIGLNDIEGIFHTHAHDDHFVGLAALIQTDHKIKYFSSKIVKLATMKKLSSLLGIEENHLSNYFDFVDLNLDEWNDINGLEVKPIYSPHPIETNNFYFRTFWNDSYKTYAHLADIVSFKVLDNMNKKTSLVDDKYCEQIKRNYLQEVDLKKIDIDGGLIHGDAKDFINDSSKKIVLAHMENNEYTNIQKAIGSNASFGSVDVLIPTNQNYFKNVAFEFLKNIYCDINHKKLEVLLNCEIITFNPGSIVVKERKKSPCLYLILSGNLEKLSVHSKKEILVYSGSFIGEELALFDNESEDTFRTDCYVNALVIPKELYLHFLETNNLKQTLIDRIEKRKDLSRFWIFNELLSPKEKNKIVNQLEYNRFEDKEEIQLDGDYLNLIAYGKVVRKLDNKEISILKENDFFGEENILNESTVNFKYYALGEVELQSVKKEFIENIPIIYWNIFSRYQKVLNNNISD